MSLLYSFCDHPPQQLEGTSGTEPKHGIALPQPLPQDSPLPLGSSPAPHPGLEGCLALLSTLALLRGPGDSWALPAGFICKAAVRQEWVSVLLTPEWPQASWTCLYRLWEVWVLCSWPVSPSTKCNTATSEATQGGWDLLSEQWATAS